MDDYGTESELDEEAKLKGQTNATLWVALGGLFGLPIIYFVWWYFYADIPKNLTDPGAWGTFGDFIGGILNPVVAFLALFWLTRSIQIQRTELRETRAALTEQASTFERQRFEGTFFSLLDQHNKVLDRLSERTPSPEPSGPGGLQSDLFRLFDSTFSRNVSLVETRKTVMAADAVVGHYFRILYQLFKLIATSSPGSTLGTEFSAAALLASEPSTEEKRYANIVRAFLGTQLTQLLAVNCYADTPDSTYWHYRRLVERYALLEHMPFIVSGELRLPLKEVYDAYNTRAFGKSEFLFQLDMKVA